MPTAFPVLLSLLTNSRSRTCSHLGIRVSPLFQYQNQLLTISSWSGFVLSRELDKKKFQTVVVSPRSYFVFTPLLASTAVGTLEFRNTLESVRARGKGVEFFQGWADDVNFNEKKIAVEELNARRPLHSSGKAYEASSIAEADQSFRIKKKGKVFELDYDKLVIAVGCYSQTFNTAGVKENAFFLKDVGDARKIRKRILECKCHPPKIELLLTYHRLRNSVLPNNLGKTPRPTLELCRCRGWS